MSRIFWTILHMSLTASYCIAVVIVLRLFLKRWPKIFSYLLWSVVLFRLLCPFSLSSSYSLLRVNTDLFSGDSIHEWSQEDAEGVQNAVNGEALWENGENAANMLSTQGVEAEDVSGIWLQKAASIGSWVWFAGMLGLVFYSIGSVVRLRRSLADTVRIEEGLYEMEGIATPFVLGISRPKIYLPAHLQEKERQYVIAHEKVHIARKDHLVKIISYAAVCIHWFNPLVWLAFVLMEADMEMSCDEAVLKKLGVGVKKEYSRSLLALSTGKTKCQGSPLAFGEGQVKGRVRNILAYRKRTVLAIVLTAIVLLVVGAGLILDPVRTGNLSEEEMQKLKVFVEAYADAFSNRNGETIVALYVDEDTALENVFMLEKTGDTYTHGLSSPWPGPDRYRYQIIPEENRADIYYYAWTSDPHSSVWKEEIHYTMVEEEYRIADSTLRILDSILSKEDFDAAYLIQDAYQFGDYWENGSVEAINYQRENGGSSVNNAVYLEPESAAEHILNLTGGTGSVESDSEYQVMVRYLFADGSEVMIPMYQANYDVETGTSSGEPLWIVDTAVWNAGAP